MFLAGPVLSVAAIGDSKTQGGTCCQSGGGAKGYLHEGLTQSAWGYPVSFGTLDSYWHGEAGQTSVTIASSIASILASMSGLDADWLLLNLGANDFVAGTSQAAYETAMGQILDAAKVKWPNLQASVMRPWRRGYDAEAASMAGWVSNVTSTRAWAHVGPDEAVFLKGADDGATYTSDGVHPNAAGYALTATQWQTAMGY